MKLCVVLIGNTPEELLDEVLAQLKPSFTKVLRSDTEVVAKPARGGLRGGLKGNNVLDFDNPYFAYLNERPIIEALIEAEREGFDAAWVNCAGDPGVGVARAVVDIPVIGPFESTLHFACQLGRQLSIITTNMPGQIAQFQRQVRMHGLQDRLVANGVRTEKEPFAGAWKKYAREPKLAAESVAEVAKECVADGAEVIVIGCCGLGPLCSMVGFNKLAIDGQDIPVLDPVMVAAKTAEMAADIRKGTGLPIPSRAKNYVLPSKEDWTRVRAIFGLSA